MRRDLVTADLYVAAEKALSFDIKLLEAERRGDIGTRARADRSFDSVAAELWPI